MGTFDPLSFVYNCLVSSQPLLERIGGIALVTMVQLALMLGCLVFINSVLDPIAKRALVAVELFSPVLFSLVDIQFADERCHKITA